MVRQVVSAREEVGSEVCAHLDHHVDACLLRSLSDAVDEHRSLAVGEDAHLNMTRLESAACMDAQGFSMVPRATVGVAAWVHTITA